MYFALEKNTNCFETYESFLMEIINNDNEKYKSIIRDILIEVRKLIETNNYYSIPSDRFSIINYLASTNILKDIDPENLNKKDFQKIFENLQLEHSID